MELNCLQCKAPLSKEYQLIFDETGIELQLDKLLADNFDIFVVRDPNVVQALCNECVNRIIELYDTQLYYEEKIESMGNDDDSHILKSIEDDVKRHIVESQEIEDGSIKPESLENEDESQKLEFIENDERSQVTTASEDDIKEETQCADDGGMTVEEIEIIEREEHFEELIAENEDEEFLGFKEIEDNVDNPKRISNFDCSNLRDYLQNVIKSDLEKLDFDQNSICTLCNETLNSHQNVLEHTAEKHQTEFEKFPCVFCENVEYFDSIANLAQHIVLKHYDLFSISIYCICPECNSRFSSFLEYNKHSCYKKNFGNRLQVECTECSKTFISNKRYRFHLQFHIEKHRPKACFICDILFSDENDFFEHIMFAHEKDESFVCHKCDRVCTTKDLYDNHMKLHDAIRSFHCPHCSKSYFYNQMLINHIQQHHTDQQTNECTICKKSLANRHLLKRHMQLVHHHETENDVLVCQACGLTGISEDDKMFHSDDNKCPGAEITMECLKIAYACEYCERAYKSIENLKEHRTTHDDKLFKCWICEGKYSEFKKLKTHILTHTNLEPIQNTFPINRHYVCNIDSCDQTYLTWPSLRAHKARHATKFTCELCTQMFSTESKLITHLKSHDNDEEFTCQFCARACVSQMSLSVHIARKHNNNFKTCEICNSALPNEEALAEHIEAQHTEAKCEECGKITKNKRNLEIHIQMIHAKVKRFFCSVCDKGYFNKSDLKTHERAVHAEPNKFKCQYCNFSTSYEESLKAHLLKHDMKKPFKCEECSKEFTRKSCFKLHCLRHSDKKPFVCPVELCGRSFVMPGILNSHMKNAHPDCENSIVKKVSQTRSAKRRRTNPKSIDQIVESTNSSDYVLSEVYSEGDFLDGDSEMVIFDEAPTEEEITLTDGNMYVVD